MIKSYGKKFSIIYILIVLLTNIFMINYLYSQESDSLSSENIAAFAADSVLFDTLTSDSIVKPEKFKLQSKIIYDADVEVSVAVKIKSIYMATLR